MQLPGPATSKPPAGCASALKGLLPRRLRLVHALVALPFCLAVFVAHRLFWADELAPYLKGLPPPELGPLPPRFYEWHEREKQLPQHNADLPYPQGKHGRYVRFSNLVIGSGWGNVMQELVLNAHLAYMSKRTYVFHNFTWDGRPEDYSEFNGKSIPARVPLTALITGPMAGDPFPTSAGMPPAVIPQFFDEVCPNRTILDSAVVNGPLAWASGATLMDAWIAKLNSVEDRCVEIAPTAPHIFDYLLFGDSRRLLDIWPALSKSPIVTHFAWSPLIAAALAANARIIHPALSRLPQPHLPASTFPLLKGLLALHIRRGDFVEHCNNLANWSSRYMGFNDFPDFPDHFPDPAEPSGGNAPPEEAARYRAHCFPEIEQIVARVRGVRRELAPSTLLKRIYVLTNGRPEWLEELKAALQFDAAREGMPRWTHIATSRDLRMTREQRHNAQAMDMAVANRADVFIGNGWSSLTSNVNMLRVAQGLAWNSTRFW
ncbi:hypothetical protein BC834DRAFT_967222 [Gloeopeniophorella convolvens]|nr:hypothetical protein BC834DRAFT_967222 [Gloeopeniophorella convolvens]